ncbi:uncharacterized protein UMAG_03062 [Mycosarcoma maydis]|uniref:Uncharacterized protein n=1 Tax=Mycosarcoma maydis TaxID=5270 RepID=A0A0D1DYD7_MYCMD|nr:uncharacterized protein UMAG_03062 [Ustilago maydis 521]KIS69084.1 hypothetical protein UMAG_03062 [Ustilago maydis 521]|eukprot:XP_011389427.1 hypothetical protein UMAG_03062 [Ustilago maydis 521]
MPSSPRKGSQPDAALDVRLPQLDKAQQLAELLAAEPERLANGDASLSALSVTALKQIFDYSISSEKDSVPSICSFIETISPNLELFEQRASRSGGKRKRGTNTARSPLFEGTPLDELVTEGMNSDQLWEQIDLKAKNLSGIVERYFLQDFLREEEENDAEEEEHNARAGPSRSRLRFTRQEDQDDEDDDEEEEEEDEEEDGDDSMSADHDDDDEDEELDLKEERVRLSQLSDADLRALGVDPALRDQLLAEIDEQSEDGDDSDEEGSAYAGASDISDGDPTEVFYEPLKTEAEQLRRKEEEEMRMLPRLRSQIDSNDDAEEDEDEEDPDDEDEEEDREDGSDDAEGSRSSSKNSAGIPKSLLEDLDRPGKATQRSSKRHPTLDDDFFSIDDLNRQLDEQDAQEEADADHDDNDDDDIADQVDYFKPISGDDNLDDDDQEDEDADQETGLVNAADAHYADFFLPPAKAAKFNKKFGKRKASARFAQEDAAADQIDDNDDESDADPEPAAERVYEEPDRKRRIRFNTTIEYRRIKPRKKSADELTPEMLRMIGASADDLDVARRFDEDDAQDNDEDMEMDMDEVESETSSIGRQGSDDESEGQDTDDEDEDHTRDDDAEDDDEEQAFTDGEQDDGIQTARRVAGDLFADSDDETDAKDKLSTHEKRVAALKDEIARLEDENVAKKDWTLMGEAGSRARPQDSLLEQDLEFERAAKVIPQVTEEMTESIEDLIKRRILERNFDDVIRRREMEALPFLPSRLLELSDSKSAKSLAELYEEEYQAARGADGGDGAPMAEADAKLAKEHEEITKLYDDIFNKLDALSNAHFTPKAPKATIQTLTNAPSVSIESALPATSSSSTMLAPEEVYERSRHSTAMDGAKSEMTPEEKQRLHNKLRQEKRQRNEKIQDTRRALEQSGLVRAKKVNEKEEKQQALKKLVGNRGVSVIGKQPNAVGAGTGKNAKNKSKPINRAANASAKPTTANQFKL